MAAPTEARMRRDVAYTPEELAQAQNSDPVRDAQRMQENVVELRQELARTKDPKIRSILMEEFNRMQGPTADSADVPGALKPVVLGVEPKPTETAPTQTEGALSPIVIGKAPPPEAPDITQSAAQDKPGAPQFVGTNAGAVTGIERPRKAGPEPEQPTVGPAEQRTAAEAGGTMLGAAAGSFLGGIGEPLGAGVGAGAGSLMAELFDPTTHPLKEALQTGAFATATAGLSTLATGGLRHMLGTPTERGQALLDIMQARGLVPPAGAVLSGSLVKNMEAIGSADAFFGQKVKQMIQDSGNVVTDDLRNFISGYQRYYGAAKEGFKVWDKGVASYLPGESGNIVALDRGVLDKLQAAEKVWASTGSAVDFPLRQVIDQVKAAEEGGHVVNAVRVNLEQAEAVRQLLHQQANALSGSAKSATSQAVGRDVVQAVRKAANQVGDDIESAIDQAVKDNRIPAQTRQILLASKDMWKQWKVGETLQDALGAQITTAGRAGEPVTSDMVRAALASIEADGAKLNRSLIGSGETARLEAIAKALQASEEAGRASQFTMAVRSGQLFTLSGAGVAAGAGNPVAGAAALAVTLIPAALGWIVRNPAASALLIRGLRTQAGTAAGLRASRDLTAMLTKEGFLAPVERTSDVTD